MEKVERMIKSVKNKYAQCVYAMLSDKQKKDLFSQVTNEIQMQAFQKSKYDVCIDTFESQNSYRIFQTDMKPEDSINILDFILMTIKNEIKYSYLTQVFYKQPHDIVPDIGDIKNIIVPYCFLKKETNCPIVSIEENEMITVDFAKHHIISVPWKVERILSALHYIPKKGFEFQPTNHKGRYYKTLELGIITNGFHSSATGIIHQKGTVDLYSIDDSHYFEKVTTDGAYWYYPNAHPEKVIDYRVAILFELTKVKLELMSKL